MAVWSKVEVSKFCLTFLVLGVLASGCRSIDQRLVLHPVGPIHRGNTRLPASGALVVRSALESGALDAGHYPHSSYELHTTDGKLYARVRNQTGAFNETPQAVSLPAGDYLVVARAQNHGVVTVPVVIESGETTTVYLDGGGSALRRFAAEDRASFICLPDGEIAGWPAWPESVVGKP